MAESRRYIHKFKRSVDYEDIDAVKVDYLKNLANIYDMLNEKDSAISYYEKWGYLKDSIQSKKSQKQLKSMESLYMMEKRKNDEITSKNKALVTSKRNQLVLGGGLLIAILTGGIIIYFMRLRTHKERERLRLEIKGEQLKQVLVAQENERKRLARELHDGIGQSLAALKMQLQMSGDNQTSKETIQKVNELSREIRSLSHQMMPLILQENGLGEALEWLADQILRKNSIKVDLALPTKSKRLPSDIETHLYRVAQELLTNIVKHSKASAVGIQLLRPKEKVILVIEDNGVGFSQNRSSNGIGLANINSRVESLGGEIEIEPNEDGGTYARIVVSLSAEGRLTA